MLEANRSPILVHRAPCAHAENTPRAPLPCDLPPALLKRNTPIYVIGENSPPGQDTILGHHTPRTWPSDPKSLTSCAFKHSAGGPLSMSHISSNHHRIRAPSALLDHSPPAAHRF